MYCAGCGQTLTNQAACPQCGRPAGSAGPRAVSEAAAAYVFQRTVRRLQQAWFLFACLNVALGVTGLALVQFGVLQKAGPWEPWPHPPLLEWTYTGGLAWALLIARVALAAAASIALRDRTNWARLATGMAAVMAFTQFPIGLMLGAFTLVKVMGPGNRSLFDKLSS